MKYRSAYPGILAMTLVIGPFAFADEASDAFKGGMREHNKGMVDVVESPAKAVEGTAGGMVGDHPVTGTVEGTVKGTGQTGDQALKGTGEMVEGTEKMLTAPIKAIAE